MWWWCAGARCCFICYIHPVHDQFLTNFWTRNLKDFGWFVWVGFPRYGINVFWDYYPFGCSFSPPFFLILLNKHQWYLMKLCHAVLIAVPIANLSSNYVPLCMMTRTCSEEKKNNCKMITIDSIFHIRTKISLTNFPNNKITVTFNFVWITVRLNPSLKHKLLTHSNHSKCASSVCIRRVSELQLTEKSM